MRWRSSGLSTSGGPSAAAAVALADAIERALPKLGRSGAFDSLIAAYSLAAAFWQIANPPERLTDAYADEPEVMPSEWNIDFASALTRVLTATCIGLRLRIAMSRKADWYVRTGSGRVDADLELSAARARAPGVVLG